MSEAHPGRPRKRGRRVLAALLGLVVAGAIIGAFLNERYIEGSVPGESPILGLAVTAKGFLVGTGEGLYSSEDAMTWERPKPAKGRALVTNAGSSALALVELVLLKTDDLSTFEPAIGNVQDGVAIAADDQDNIYVAEDAKTIVLYLSSGGIRRATVQKGPKEIVAFDAVSGDPVTLFAGGLTSGFWRSTTGGSTWRHILKTPVRAIVVDPENPKRVFIGTAGGVLYSTDGGLRWQFTEMRSSVEAITAARGKVWVVTQDRLIFSSDDGVSNYQRPTA